MILATRTPPAVDAGKAARLLSVWALAILAAVLTVNPSLSSSIGRLVVVGALFVALITGARLTALDWLGLTFVGWMLASTIWADLPERAFTVAASTVVGFLFFLAVRHSTTDRRSFMLVASGFIVGCVVAQYQLIVESDQSLGQVLRSALSFTAVTLENELVRATLGETNANYLSYSFCAGAALVVAMCHLLRSKVVAVLLVALYATTCIAGLALTGTRGAMYGLALLGVWLVVGRLAPRIMLPVMVGLASLAQLAIMFGVSENWVGLVERSRETGTLSGRTVIWEWAVDLWFEHPLIGNGAGALAGAAGLEAHNAILNVAAGAGLVGVVLLVAFWWSIGRPRFDKSIPVYMVTGAFIAVSLPAFLTGAWEILLPSWVFLALLSNVDRVFASPPKESVTAPTRT